MADAYKGGLTAEELSERFECEAGSFIEIPISSKKYFLVVKG